jgi:hypothetical protein
LVKPFDQLRDNPTLIPFRAMVLVDPKRMAGDFEQKDVHVTG